MPFTNDTTRETLVQIAPHVPHTALVQWHRYGPVEAAAVGSVHSQYRTFARFIGELTVYMHTETDTLDEDGYGYEWIWARATDGVNIDDIDIDGRSGLLDAAATMLCYEAHLFAVADDAMGERCP